MKATLMTGVVLIVLGAAALGYDHFSYTTTENILQIGPISATAEEKHTVSIPPLVGWLLIGGGVCVIAIATLSKKD
ncbi:MAG TPA: hypothetical protein VJ673_19690 [Aromatoleum sp.]|uniref:hypothetical protein n=1 Tax=Aromatoleum sp. TaxID=2307007 RepID=UPI002B4A42FB|nr:hypothetical protein [Aromatoleum sp.]HJV27914.1 hypothetical protein [Aromatoleum sp.]